MTQELAPGANTPARPDHAPGPPPPASGRTPPDTSDPAAVIARARAVWEDYRQTWNRPAGEPRPSDTMMAISACLAAERLPEILPLAEEAADLRALFDLQQTRVQAATERWRAEDPEARAGVLPDMGRLLDWLMADADRLRRELDRWESGQRRKGLPVVESVPDGVTYAARLLHAQGTEGSDEHNDLLRAAAERLKQLSDAASHLLAEAVVLRAPAGRYDDAVAALRDIDAYGRWWSEQDTTMTVTLGPWALRAAADYLDAVRESRFANRDTGPEPDTARLLAVGVIRFAALGGMPDTFWLTDTTIRAACTALDCTPEQARAAGRAGVAAAGEVGAQVAAVLALLDQPGGRTCTGLTARWCPIHGDCTCQPSDARPETQLHSSPDCPLHGPTSTHGGTDAG